MSSSEVLKLYTKHVKFMDITETQDLDQLRRDNVEVMMVPVLPTKATQQSIVKPILARGGTELMKATLTKLTEFNNRYYRATTGQQSSDWLFGQITSLVVTANTSHLTVSVTQFAHTWTQKSIIARIEGLNKNVETVIIGAHQDSINQMSPMSGRAPGADDDGSGSVTILEAFRMLLVAGYQPLRPIEFHWYSGEEAGLLGSQAIVKAYAQNQRVVAGMLQLDMTMYPTKSRKDIGIVTDYVDPKLTAFLKSLVPEYTSVPVGEFRCGYGCSDHASWNRAGYPSAIPFESSNMHENGNIHTPRDSLNTVDYEHGLELAKLAVGFVVEMSHV